MYFYNPNDIDPPDDSEELDPYDDPIDRYDAYRDEQEEYHG